MTGTRTLRKFSRLRVLTRFSLRTALLAMTVLAAWLALHMQSVRRQRAGIEAAESLGAWIGYDYRWNHTESPVPQWLLEPLGRNHFHSVVHLSMNGRTGPRANIDEGRRLHAFERLENLAELERLWIDDPRLSDKELACMGQLTSLRELVIRNASAVTDQGVAHLANLQQLEHLVLSECPLTDESIRHLGRLPKLQSLSFRGHGFTDKGLEHMQTMTQLRYLHLGTGTKPITDDGLAHLKRLTQLRQLILSDSTITEHGLQHLGGLEQLEHLWLENSQVKDPSWLRARLPDCEIIL